MLYEFIDTVRRRDDEERTLPAEAMQIDGEYIEDMIDGYQTLYVRGRESMLAEINSYETGVRDGSGITSKRFPARELVIGYLLRAESNEAFRDAYNKLNSILNTQDAQIIFADEEDKYFIGTPEGLEEVEPGRNLVQGEIIIFCADPFKYSVEEYSYEMDTTSDGKSFRFDYNGIYKARPTLEASFDSDCGYVWWQLADATGSIANGKNIIVGDMSEQEGEDYTTNQTLISQNFKSSSASLSSWTADSPFVWIGNASNVGTLGNYWGAFNGTCSLSTSRGVYPSVFNNESSAVWRGTSISRTVPADINGDVGATNWKIGWTQVFALASGYSASNCMGGVQVIAMDASNNMIAAVGTYNCYLSGSYGGLIDTFTKNQGTAHYSYDFAYGNSRFGSGGYCTMTKSGSTVSFNMNGLSFSLTDSGISSSVVTQIMIVFLKSGGFTVATESVYDVSFLKNNISAWRDTSNTFGRNDTVTADCASGMIYVNGAEHPEYGVIGNDWETFCLEPGSQYGYFNRSNWVSSSNTTSMKIRWHEVFI